jgi:pectin methylesterase-like acyl-CoA thioesterase
MKRQLGILSVAVLVIAGFASTTRAAGRPRTLRVCSNGPFRNIQPAVDAARPGDTVQICPGTYVEGTGVQGSNALTIAKDLTLSGTGADQVRIEARHGADLPRTARTSTAARAFSLR